MDYCELEKAKEIVTKKLNDAFLSLNLGSRGFVMPLVVWREMGMRRAGTCNYRSNTITLNTNYLKSKDWKNFLDITPLHELAHAVSYQIYGVHGHKGKWKEVCHQMGLLGDRCHHYATPEVENANKWKRKRYKASCSCMVHEITSVRYNRILKGYQYSCVKCHSVLHLI